MKKGIKDIRDNKVRDLAQTLKASGMAASETEAIRMARDMTDTASKVTENIEDKERGDEVGVTYKQEKSAEEVMPEKTSDNSSQTNPKTTQKPQKTQTEEPTETLSEDPEDKVRVDDGTKTVDQGLEQEGEKPEDNEVDFSEVSVEEAAGLEPENEEEKEPEPEQAEQETTTTQDEQTPRGKPREEHTSEVEEHDTSTQSEPEEEPQPQETQEKEAEKNPEDFAESDVDLSETFKFS